jgi:predicted nucleic acid binding AN1-type Zn finger protein
MAGYPKRNIAIGSVVLRRQPPVVIDWCKPPTPEKAGDAACVSRDHGCDGATTVCSLCRFPYCAAHLRRHRFLTDYPTDLWQKFSRKRRAWYAAIDAPRTRPTRALDVRTAGGAVASSEPPVVGTFCLAPTARNSRAPACVFPAKTCHGEPAACPVCGHRFCAHHLQRHRGRFEAPAPTWLELEAGRRAWLKKVRRKPSCKPRVYIHFPGVPP